MYKEKATATDTYEGRLLESWASIHAVLRAAYLEETEDLRVHAEKVRATNRSKKAVREYLAALRDFRATVLTSARERNLDWQEAQSDPKICAPLFEMHGHPYARDDVAYERGLPASVPPPAVTTVRLLEDEIARWNDELAAAVKHTEHALQELRDAMQEVQRRYQGLDQALNQRNHLMNTLLRAMAEMRRGAGRGLGTSPLKRWSHRLLAIIVDRDDSDSQSWE